MIGRCADLPIASTCLSNGWSCIVVTPASNLVDHNSTPDHNGALCALTFCCQIWDVEFLDAGPSP